MEQYNIDGNKDLARDPITNAIININELNYEQYVSIRELKNKKNQVVAFMEGEFDVLVSTTIIENGLDIPNANTIIINNAQNFGLSDLHQMRGRVGRSVFFPS